jgi:hypothetical protein
MLKDNGIARLARHKVPAANWQAYMCRIDTLRQGNEKQGIVADLVLAHRIRGSVHQELPEGDAWALENLFAGLIRAAVYTFAHTRASMP